ncbi:probable ADP-ribosylation factor GTPase-activating protein AGD14 [Nymphaea colorata]|nr:probable ADP-ribosylation factor GTPase-activating protein AGD14 [Nymphaea colorata]XP_031498721.1 probable ADP-ribosylation factor GTPase-activating protein AGD14 [Nymphaea colorata]XP_049935975.1 probable ADP-ribosylation factor GTPase-activating protein AGD14 [Nymphaea colorata]
MSSRKEEERNEKIIRGLMKLPPNRRCINCNSLGPQYVCTNFWTFVCTTCSGIHREFTHRVKSVSMAKFTSQEVEALQRGGNQRAREIYLKDWDTQRLGFPSISNVDRIREFIKNVYVDKKFAGSRTSDKPPRDTVSQRNNDVDNRRASSYHSYSQSPPYEHEYEERRYGKQPAMLSRKPGSDRVQYEGKISSFIYSPGRLSDHVMYEDRFANEGLGVNPVDYSGSSHGHRRSDVQSPNFQKETGFNSPPVRAVRDILADDRNLPTASRSSEDNSRRAAGDVTRPQKTMSTGSFGSIDSNSMSLKPVVSSSLIDINFDSGPVPGPQQNRPSFNPTFSQTVPSSSASQNPFDFPSTNSATSVDLFADVSQQQSSAVMPSIDLFANVNQQQLSPAPSTDLFGNVMQPKLSSICSQQKLPSTSFTDSEGWATFDSPQQLPLAPEMKSISIVMTSREVTLQQQFEAFSSENDRTHLPSDPSSNGPSGSQWNAFDAASGGNLPVPSGGSVTQGEPAVHTVLPTATANQLWNSISIEELTTTRYQSSLMKDGPSVNSFTNNSVVSASSFPLSGTPFMGDESSDFKSVKSTNPFDLPYDSDGGENNVFLDMGSLQAALPNPQLPNNFVSGLNPSWFPPGSVPPCMPPASQGSTTFIGGQAPPSQLLNLPTQGPVAPLGGNPFA